MTLCEACQTDAGRTYAGRRCCQIRELVHSPPHAIKSHTDTLTAEQKDVIRPEFIQMKVYLKQLKRKN